MATQLAGRFGATLNEREQVCVASADSSAPTRQAVLNSVDTVR
jgi:hypothetical protein